MKIVQHGKTLKRVQHGESATLSKYSDSEISKKMYKKSAQECTNG